MQLWVQTPTQLPLASETPAQVQRLQRKATMLLEVQALPQLHGQALAQWQAWALSQLHIPALPLLEGCALPQL